MPENIDAINTDKYFTSGPHNKATISHLRKFFWMVNQNLKENRVYRILCTVEHEWCSFVPNIHWHSQIHTQTTYHEYGCINVIRFLVRSNCAYLFEKRTLKPSKKPEVRKYLSAWLCSIRLSPRSFPAPIVYCGTGSGPSLLLEAVEAAELGSNCLLRLSFSTFLSGFGNFSGRECSFPKDEMTKVFFFFLEKA